AGAGTGNTINEDDEAYVHNSQKSDGNRGVTARNGSISLTATDNSSITANAGGFGIGLARSVAGTAIGASIGLSAATNDVEHHVLADADRSSLTSSTGDVTLSASETATIQALTIGGAVAVGAGGGATGVGIGAAGAGSGNTIKNHVMAFAQDGAVLTASLGKV